MFLIKEKVFHRHVKCDFKKETTKEEKKTTKNNTEMQKQEQLKSTVLDHI